MSLKKHVLVMIDVLNMYKMHYIFSREIPGLIHWIKVIITFSDSFGRTSKSFEQIKNRSDELVKHSNK